MGFLDRMVADLVADSTGLPVRRVVRRVGAKRLLLLGGAALAGGAIAHGVSQSRQTAPSVPPPPTGDVPPPPPPPPPGAAPPPPPPTAASLPPLPDTEPDLSADLTYAIIRAMVGAALADGHLSDDEKRTIHDHLGESGLAADRVQQIHRDLVLPPSPDELASMIGDPNDRRVMYRAAVLVAHADREVSDLERSWLDRLATRFDIPESERAAILTDLQQLA